MSERVRAELRITAIAEVRDADGNLKERFPVEHVEEIEIPKEEIAQ